MYTRPSHRDADLAVISDRRTHRGAGAPRAQQLVLKPATFIRAAWTVYERAGFSRAGGHQLPGQMVSDYEKDSLADH